MLISALYNPKRLTALLASLLLIISQLATVVHASEHPFHVADEWCHVYQSAEHHDLSISAGPSLDIDIAYRLYIHPPSDTPLVETAFASCQPRAPPVFV